MARALWCGWIVLSIAASACGQASLPAVRTLVPAAPSAPSATSAAMPTAKPAANLPIYEVSTIRLNNEGGWRQRWDETPDGVIYENLTIADLIVAAYGTGHPTDDQVIDIPGWAKEKRYNLTAKVGVDDADRLKGLKYKDRQRMLAAVLEDRFNLKVHHEMRDMPHYALRVAKNGPRLKPATPLITVKTQADEAQPDDGTMHVTSLARTTHSEWQDFTMERFAENMTWVLWQLHRQIVDETGLTARYDFTLDWSSDQGGDDGTASAPGIFTAMQNQLGLKLQLLKSPLDCVIVDHVEEPTPN